MSKCRVLKEPVVVNRVVIYFRKHHYLVQAVDRTMSWFKAAGLVDYWIAMFEKDKSIPADIYRPKVRTFSDLLGAFLILVYGLTAAAICFVAETLISRLSSQKPSHAVM